MIKTLTSGFDQRKDFSGPILQIPKSKDGYLRDFRLTGKSAQKQTVLGKNILNNDVTFWQQGSFNPGDGTTNGATSRIRSKYGSFYTGTYTISLANYSNYGWVLYCYDTNYVYLPDESYVGWQFANITINVPDRRYYKIGIRFRVEGTPIAPAEISNVKVQIESGSTATPYEPFVPSSPTPEYPSEIKTVPELLDITSCGKNLLPLQPVFNNSTQRLLDFGVDKVFENGNVFSFYVTDFSYKVPSAAFVSYVKTDGTQQYRVGTQFFKENGERLEANEIYTGRLRQTNVLSVTFKHLSFFGYTTGYSQMSGTIYNAQLEEGATATPYEPYRGSTTTITLKDTEGNLHTPKSLPDGTRDEVDLDGGESVERVKRLVVTSGDGWRLYAGGANVSRLYFYDSANKWDVNETIDSVNIACNIARPEAFFSNPDTVYFRRRYAGTALYLKVLNSELSSLDDDGAIQWAQNQVDTHGPIVFDYPLAEPKPWTLHPDERKKIITVDSEKAYIYTDAEVQPEIVANVISYGED